MTQSSNRSTSAGDIGSTQGEFTGKTLVLLRDNGLQEGLQAIRNAAGLTQVCNAADYTDGAVEMADAGNAEVFLLDHLKLAVVNADPNQLSGLHAAADDDGAIIAVEPERMMYALATTPGAAGFSSDYLRGYRDAVTHLYDEYSTVTADPDIELEALANFADTATFTWGLQATGVNRSRYSGRGVRVAVLDAGFDLNHPDFVGRNANNQSFIPGQLVDDLNGHGTHCIGTALGAQHLAGRVRRYGCAFNSEIFVGKVLSNQGSGSDSAILAGINWAITNRCRVISMSLGARVQLGEPYSQVYEAVAQRALRSNPGTLIVAAAGNDSGRPGLIWPVGRPANCPSIFAVGALDSRLGIASFSNGGLNPSGGGVDIAGPGVDVFSSVPEPFPAAVQPTGPRRPWPARYHTISGTSMATPHVAGIAAMWLEALGGTTSARALWQTLTSRAVRLTLPSRDVGAGLVQAP